MAAGYDTLPPGTTFGSYTVKRLLGTGGMGAVYEVEHSSLGSRFALKTIHSLVAQKPSVITRFVREAKATTKMRHPHIIVVTDAGEEGSTPYLVMELLTGKSLGHHLHETGAVDAQQMVEWMMPVIDGLQAAHEENVLHRDLKPDNIFLAQERYGVMPKILDFGVSKLLDHPSVSNITGNAVVGTPHYMAPEQARGSEDIDASADQYAVGTICYELVAGRLPFEDYKMPELLLQIVVGGFPPPSDYVDIDPELEKVILRAMATEREDRFASMDELGQALIAFGSDETRQMWTRQLAQTKRVSDPVPADSPARKGADALMDTDVDERVPTVRAASAPVSVPRPRATSLASIAVAFAAGVLLAAGVAWAILG